MSQTSRSAILALTLSFAAIFHAQAPKPMPPDADPSFEVATIKVHNSISSNPRAGFVIDDIQGDRYSARNVSLQDLIKLAYNLQLRQISGLPKWADETRYDITAVMQPEGAPSPDQFRTMLRKLLDDRFKLTTHNEQRTLSAFALTVVKSGAKMPISSATVPTDSEHPAPGGTQFIFRGFTVKTYAAFLQRALVDRPVVDQTGLPESTLYDFDLIFLPDETMFGGRFRPSPETLANPGPNLFTALQEQLGLKLSPEKIPTDILVIDHVETPSAN